MKQPVIRSPKQDTAAAIALGQAGRFAQAESILRKILKRHPKDTQANAYLGFLLIQTGRPAKADLPLRIALSRDPNNARIALLLGIATAQIGDLIGSLPRFNKALLVARQSGSVSLVAEVLHNLALAQDKLGRHDEAVTSLLEAVLAAPGNIEARIDLGRVLSARRDHLAALAQFETIIAARPDYAAAHCGAGFALEALQRRDEAIKAYETAVALQRDDLQAWNNLGILYNKQGARQKAYSCFAKLNEVTPVANNMAVRRSMLHNQASLLVKDHRYAEAAQIYRQLMREDGDDLKALSQLIAALSAIGDWGDIEELTDRLVVIVGERSRAAKSIDILPWQALLLPLSPGNWREIAASHADKTRREAGFDESRICHRRIADAGAPLRVGYVSPDFRNHPTYHLMGGLFRAQDRNKVIPYAYSLGPDDGSQYREQAQSEAAVFRDCQYLSDVEIANLVASDQIDILVDLGGYTMHTKPAIFWHRPAPLQVNYLGYAGTLGDPCYDYIIVDPVIVPPDQASAFTEALAYMPDAYQANDPRDLMPPHRWSREELGLPADAIVYCGFHNAGKITPAIFRTWMDILRQVPGSVLWLLSGHPALKANLQQYAAALAVDAARLIFAPPGSRAQYLGYFDHVDLFLDTPVYNAHTTASDALRRGVPIVTVPGTSFQARVAASLCRAAGLNETIAHGFDAYRDTAVRLAKDRAELSRLKEMLKANYTTAPLFDITRFAGNLDRLYQVMADGHRARLQPHAILPDPS